MSVELDERGDEHHWILKGHRVTQLLVDLSSFRFQTWSLQASAEIRVGAPFQFEEPDGVRRTIDPEEPQQLGPVLNILGRDIDALTISRAGTLAVQLSDGSRITIDSHPRHAAWEIQGAGAMEGMQYLAQPGGGQSWR